MPNNEELNYHDDIQVDQNKLDLEWANLPVLFDKWSKRLINEENNRDRIKLKLELLYSEIDLKIRTSPSEYVSDGKFSEGAVKSAIKRNPDYQVLREELADSKYRVSVFKLAVKGIKNKIKTIDRLTKLYTNNYYIDGEVSKANPQKTLNASMTARELVRDRHGRD